MSPYDLCSASHTTYFSRGALLLAKSWLPFPYSEQRHSSLVSPSGGGVGSGIGSSGCGAGGRGVGQGGTKGRGNGRRGDKGEATEGVAMEGEATEDEAEVGSDSMTHNAPTVRGIQSYILKDHIPRGTGKRDFQKHVWIPFPAEPW